MSRNPELEALLQAKFDLDTCADDQQDRYRQRFDKLLDQALSNSSRPEVRREMLEES
jgi:hypothetical protein